MDTKMTALARFGATQARAISKAAVLYTLGAALFCAANEREEKPLARNKRREAFEGAGFGRATERHWLLGVTVAKVCADAVTEILASANDADAGAMVDRLAQMLANDARAETDAEGNAYEITDGKGRVVWAKLDGWVSGRDVKAPKTPMEKAQAMVKAVDKLAEDASAAQARALAEALAEVQAKAREVVKMLRDRADAFEALTADGHGADAADAAARDAADKLAA
jgi:hypothetical protein